MKTTLIVILALLVGCDDDKRPSAQQTTIESTQEATDLPKAQTVSTTVEVVDDAGRKVIFEKIPKRILSLAPANTELVFAVGAGEQLVGRTSNCDYPEEVEKIPSVGSLFPPDYEKIVGVRPDLILMTGGSEEIRTRLEDRGLTVLVVEPKDVASVADALRRLGRVVGRLESGNMAAKAFENALAAESVKADENPIRVFYEVWPSPITAAGPRSFVGDLIRVAGGHNVVTVDEAWPRPAVEKILAADPEIIIVARPADKEALLARKRSGWHAVTAVKRGHVYSPPNASLLVRPGPRLIEGLRWLKARLAESRP